MQAIFSLIYLLIALFIVVKSADFAIRYSTKIAHDIHLPSYVVGFLIVALVSILPETFISITSAIDGIPSFGLGVLFGSNVADLTLVMFLIIIFSGKSLSVESKIIKNRLIYLCVLFVPIILGFDGYYSRMEGIILIIIGLLFYIFVLKDHNKKDISGKRNFSVINFLLLILSMAVLLFGANMTVKYGVNLANILKVSPVLVGMLVVALGTTLPELAFSSKSAKGNHDTLALGDMLGTVIADATLVVGIIATINPFFFAKRIIYVTGIFMVLSASLLLSLMKTGRKLTKTESYILVIFYLCFVVSELVAGMIMIK